VRCELGIGALEVGDESVVFDKNLAEYAVSKFDRAGINIKGSRHVTKVGEGYLECGSGR
jgi:NADH dehydrogenase FAD-containing subunit